MRGDQEFARVPGSIMLGRRWRGGDHLALRTAGACGDAGAAGDHHSDATVAWSGTPSPEVAGISLDTLLGLGSGESNQLKFAGSGWVVVQPYEEAYFH
jgi:hypothetical protein